MFVRLSVDDVMVSACAERCYDCAAVSILNFNILLFKKNHMYRDDWIDMLFIVFAE